MQAGAVMATSQASAADLPEPIDGVAEFAGALTGLGTLIIVENLPVPFDRRVWQEARTLRAAGATVSIICPTGKGYEATYEELEGIHVYRHPLPPEGASGLAYLREYSAALYWQFRLSLKIWRRHGFKVIHGCNPPDLVFVLAWFYKLFGKKYLFDHHDICPELYEAKFERRDLLWRAMVLLERLTFLTADVVISTNNSYRQIALERGHKRPEDVFVVRSGPDLSRVKAVAPNPALKAGRKYLVGYVGVMGEQEGVDLLLEAVRHIVYELDRHDVQFYLVGGGPSLADLRAQSEAMGLADYVTFSGRAPDQLLFEVLSTSDVCVNPDRVNPMNDKSTMNKILEYMALSKPIVQFDVTEGRFSAGDSSLYAKANDPKDMAEKLLELLADPARRQAMGEIGRQRVLESLSWRHEVPKLIEAYRAVQR